MIDLNNYEPRLNRYGGSEEKRTYFKDGKFYMVKIPDKVREKNNSLSYMNNTFSEYICCHIFEMLGIKVQRTDLSKLNVNNKENIVCVCEDFTDENHTLIEYCNSENENKQEEISTNANEKSKELDINNIIKSIYNNKHIKEKEIIIKQFWNVFIVDALIYNRDRHNENWGFLEDNRTGEDTFAPVYDCGSALFALYSEEKCNYIINHPQEFKNLALNAVSAMKENGKKIVYYNYINSLQNEECNNALKRIYKKINLSVIDNFIDNIDVLPATYKSFYKDLIETSYNLVLTPAYNKLLQQEETASQENFNEDAEDEEFDDYSEEDNNTPPSNDEDDFER